MTKIAVVILNFNGKSLLLKFLPSVLEFSPGASVIVADNFSTDGSVEMVRKEFPAIDVIEIRENLGFCGGYNFALQRIQAEYYVLLNSDVEVTKDWLVPLTGILDNDSSVAAVQPRILAYDRKDTFEYAGAAGGFIDLFGYPFCRGRLFDDVETDNGQYSDECPIFWATGACLAIRSDDFHRMGGFDADFFAHMEEIDLCWKLNRAGRQVYYAGKSVVYHIGGGTLSRLNPRKTYLNFRNGLFLLLKNMSVPQLLWRLPIRVMFDWLALISFVRQGTFSNASAVIRAHAHFIVGFVGTLKKREEYRRIGFKVPNGLIYQGSIVIAFFGRKKKTYKELVTR